MLLSLGAAVAALALTAPAGADPTKLGADIAQTNADARRSSEDANATGALHEFAFERGALYGIETAPARVTDMALEPGEQLLSISAGDTTRWIVSDARSGAGAALQPHILVKPNAAGLETNLVIMTDRRVYHVELKSSAGPAMAAIAWRYPPELLIEPIASRTASLATPSAATPSAAPAFAPESINTHYKLSGDKPDWRPLAVFDDGHQVFIEMPPRFAKVEAPPLFVSGPDGAEVVNYRIRGAYYIVDRLFTQAEMRLGTGWGARTVKIERTTPIGGDHG
jgi:type IV secretion system protein VirB9